MMMMPAQQVATALLLFLTTTLQISCCSGFTAPTIVTISYHGGTSRQPPTRGLIHSTRLSVAFSSPSQPLSSSSSGDNDDVNGGQRKPKVFPNLKRQRRPPNRNPQQRRTGNNYNKRYGRDDEVSLATKWKRAEQTEHQLNLAVEAMQQSMIHNTTKNSNNNNKKSARVSGLIFPPIRECNAALATFGDAHELLRALRLFMRMRKAAALARHLYHVQGWTWPVPEPTLVTYSTIMSRANRMGKPRVALRMWKLMISSSSTATLQKAASTPPPTLAPTTAIMKVQYANNSSTSSATPTTTNNGLIIVPDIKAANILMNSYAKLGEMDAAQDLLQQMLHGNGTDVPKLQPNLITYNTLLDACHRCGDLDAALAVKEQMEQAPHIRSLDAWSYTSLISTVARKASAASGAHDPTVAFSLLAEMDQRHIRPNGMTYSALIDACGRCQRSDLALKVLRKMLRQKALEQLRHAKTTYSPTVRTDKQQHGKYNVLPNEVGAWTAAIHVMGKSGRLETASKLFYAMPNFGVEPNTVTCGSLTDSLLKHGRMAEALAVLRYMKRKGIEPSEVMYCSLMSSAGTLVQQEQRQQSSSLDTDIGSNQELTVDSATMDGFPDNDDCKDDDFDGETSTGAIEVYTELIKCVMGGGDQSGSSATTRNHRRPAVGDSNALLLKVFLVFQEMKAVGAQPDTACYNALLRACSRAGDVNRAQSVLCQMQEESLDPNDTSWRLLMRVAGNVGRCDIALDTWKFAVHYHDKNDGGAVWNRKNINNKTLRPTRMSPSRRGNEWKPSIGSFAEFASAYVRKASDSNLKPVDKVRLYRQVVFMYDMILSGAEDEKLGLHRVDKEELLKSPRAMLLILQAIVLQEQLLPPKEELTRTELRARAASVLKLEVLRDITTHQRLSRDAFRALQTAESWMVQDNFEMYREIKTMAP